MSSQIFLLLAAVLGLVVGWALGRSRVAKDAEQGKADELVKLTSTEARVRQAMSQ
jgi:hypothetical protein